MQATPIDRQSQPRIRFTSGTYKGSPTITTDRDESAIVIVNPDQRDWARHRYVLWFGAYASTRLMIWANSLESAIEDAAEWLAEHAPGHLMAPNSPEYIDLLRDACKDHGIEWDPDRFYGGIDSEIEAVIQDAEADLTYTESGYLTSYEWGICLEDPTREDLASFVASL